MLAGLLLIVSVSSTSGLADVRLSRATAELPGTEATLAIEQAGFADSGLDDVRRLLVSRPGLPDVKVPLRSSAGGNHDTELYQLGPERFLVVSADDCIQVGTSPLDISPCRLDQPDMRPVDQKCMAKADARGVLALSRETGAAAPRYLGKFDWRNGTLANGEWGYGFFFSGPDKSFPTDPSSCKPAPVEETLSIERELRAIASGDVRIERTDLSEGKLAPRAVKQVSYSEKHDEGFERFAVEATDHRSSVLASLIDKAPDLKVRPAEGTATAGDLVYAVVISMPSAEAYTVTLTVTDGDSKSEWRVTRSLDAIDSVGEAEDGRVVVDRNAVLRAVGGDLNRLGAEACSVVLGLECEAG